MPPTNYMHTCRLADYQFKLSQAVVQSSTAHMYNEDSFLAKRQLSQVIILEIAGAYIHKLGLKNGDGSRAKLVRSWLRKRECVLRKEHGRECVEKKKLRRERERRETAIKERERYEQTEMETRGACWKKLPVFLLGKSTRCLFFRL